MSERSGRPSRRPFAYFDPGSSSWRTCQGSFPLGSLPEPSPTWPRSGTWDLGNAYERPTWARRTAANVSSLPPGLLPTPRATDGTKGGPNQRGSSGDLMLPSAVQLLPTPVAHDSGNTPEQHLAKK